MISGLATAIRTWLKCFALVVRFALLEFASTIALGLIGAGLRVLAIAMILGLYSSFLPGKTQSPNLFGIDRMFANQPSLELVSFIAVLVLIGLSGHFMGLMHWKTMNKAFLSLTVLLLEQGKIAGDGKIESLAILQIAKNLVTLVSQGVALIYLYFIIIYSSIALGVVLFLLSIGAMSFSLFRARRSTRLVAAFNSLANPVHGDVDDDDSSSPGKLLRTAFQESTSRQVDPNSQIAAWVKSDAYRTFMAMRREIVLGRQSSQATTYAAAGIIALIPLVLSIHWPDSFPTTETLFLAGLLGVLAQFSSGLASSIAFLGKFHEDAKRLVGLFPPQVSP